MITSPPTHVYVVTFCVVENEITLDSEEVLEIVHRAPTLLSTPTSAVNFLSRQARQTWEDLCVDHPTVYRRDKYPGVQYQHEKSCDGNWCYTFAGAYEKCGFIARIQYIAVKSYDNNEPT